MRFLRFLPLVAVMFAGACARDAKVTNVTRPPLAFIRYVHAVPDVGPLDFKFIDAIEYSPTYANATYRTVGIYQGARAGSRRIRVFRNSSDINITQIALVDTTLNLVAGQYYTILHSGYSIPASGTPAQRLVVLEDNRPAQNTGLHVSAVNAIVGPGTANQDVFVGAPAGTPLFPNVAPGTRTTYAARATGTFTLHTAATGTLVSLASATPIAGVAGTAAADPVGGHGQAGTQFSAFLFPRSTAGSGAPQTAAFTAPSITIVVDRQPPRTVPE
jgi:hypothetical protein